LFSGGVGGEDEDTKFFTFCHGDPLVLFMWHHWDRGRAVPAHCTTLLDEDASLDIGASGAAHNAGKSPKRDKLPASPKPSALEKILMDNGQTMKSIRDHLCSPPASVTSKVSVTLQDLLAELRSYSDAKKMLPESHHADIDKCIHDIGLEMVALRNKTL
jgi:hypothetical protein